MDINELHDALEKAVRDFEDTNDVRVAKVNMRRKVFRTEERMVESQTYCGPIFFEIEVAK